MEKYIKFFVLYCLAISCCFCSTMKAMYGGGNVTDTGDREFDVLIIEAGITKGSIIDPFSEAIMRASREVKSKGGTYFIITQGEITNIIATDGRTTRTDSIYHVRYFLIDEGLNFIKTIKNEDIIESVYDDSNKFTGMRYINRYKEHVCNAQKIILDAELRMPPDDYRNKKKKDDDACCCLSLFH